MTCLTLLLPRSLLLHWPAFFCHLWSLNSLQVPFHVVFYDCFFLGFFSFHTISGWYLLITCCHLPPCSCFQNVFKLTLLLWELVPPTCFLGFSACSKVINFPPKSAIPSVLRNGRIIKKLGCYHILLSFSHPDTPHQSINPANSISGESIRSSSLPTYLALIQVSSFIWIKAIIPLSDVFAFDRISDFIPFQSIQHTVARVTFLKYKSGWRQKHTRNILQWAMTCDACQGKEERFNEPSEQLLGEGE